MASEYAFELASSSIRFGPGVTREIGMDLAEMKAKRVMVLTDPNLARLSPVATVLESLRDNRIAFSLFDRVHVEPTDVSFREAIDFATRANSTRWCGRRWIHHRHREGGESLLHPSGGLSRLRQRADRKGKPAPGPLKPLIAVPTTAGTGSETTGVAIFDYTPLHAKTGIAHRRLKPLLGILDPENTRSMPPQVAATSGFDVLSHAIESYTAIPYQRRPRPDRPVLRPAYQGSNPSATSGRSKALRWVSKYFVRAVEDPDDDEARQKMQLAASYAGVGFGNAGVHLPHGMSYPVSGWSATSAPRASRATIPSCLTGCRDPERAAVFRFTAQACPERHLVAAEILGADVSRARPEDAGRSSRTGWSPSCSG